MRPALAVALIFLLVQTPIGDLHRAVEIVPNAHFVRSPREADAVVFVDKRQLMLDSLRNQLRVLFVIVHQNYAELVAAKTHRIVAFAYRRGNGLRQQDDRPVALVVPLGVINVLQFIQIQRDDHDARTLFGQPLQAQTLHRRENFTVI